MENRRGNRWKTETGKVHRGRKSCSENSSDAIKGNGLAHRLASVKHSSASDVRMPSALWMRPPLRECAHWDSPGRVSVFKSRPETGILTNGARRDMKNFQQGITGQTGSAPVRY